MMLNYEKTSSLLELEEHELQFGLNDISQFFELIINYIDQKLYNEACLACERVPVKFATDADFIVLQNSCEALRSKRYDLLLKQFANLSPTNDYYKNMQIVIDYYREELLDKCAKAFRTVRLAKLADLLQLSEDNVLSYITKKCWTTFKDESCTYCVPPTSFIIDSNKNTNQSSLAYRDLDLISKMVSTFKKPNSQKNNGV
ncbi:hypothetical protein GJ496_006875 [Pomphorhynchus laevis]|nr:hypothetical protein GJ496_006875 [Pomphorhynchus laevis]